MLDDIKKKGAVEVLPSKKPLEHKLVVKFSKLFVDGFFVFFDYELVSSIMQLFEVLPKQVHEKDALFYAGIPFDDHYEKELNELASTIFFGTCVVEENKR